MTGSENTVFFSVLCLLCSRQASQAFIHLQHLSDELREIKVFMKNTFLSKFRNFAGMQLLRN
jgi:hypothetical protein